MERAAVDPRRLAELRAEFLLGQYWQFISIDEFIDTELRTERPDSAPSPDSGSVAKGNE